jgi:hypothetical protein
VTAYTSPSIAVALVRSERMHSALMEAMGEVEVDAEWPRQDVAQDACALAFEHGTGLRQLMEAGLESSAVGLLRMQFEALLRAAWVSYAAKDTDVRAMAAPLTPETSKAAKSLPLTGAMLADVEKSERAPPSLKLALREFKDSSWEALNSYVHSGIHPLRRVGLGHHEQVLLGALRASNALCYATAMLKTGESGHADRHPSINVVVTAFSDCMPPHRA